MPIGGSMTNYPFGFASGLLVRGMPMYQTQPGNIFWVNNSTTLNVNAKGASDGNRGSYLAPFSTLQHGVDSCTAGRGDTIIVGAGHAETISSSTALALNKAGIAVIGLGSGSLRPTFTIDTAATATVGVSANDISIQNCLFIANFADIAAVFTLTTAKNFSPEACEYRDTSSILNFLSVVKVSTTNAAADGLSIMNSKRIGAGATANTCILDARANIDRLTIQGNYFAHALAANSALIYQATTTKTLTNTLIDSNKMVFVGADAATGLLLITTATTHSGIISNNYVNGLRAIATATLVTANSGFNFYNNYYHLTADVSGVILPAAQT